MTAFLIVGRSKMQNAGNLAFCIFSQFLFVFPFCGHTAANVALLLILIQNLTHLGVEGVIILPQTLGQILMYRGF